MVGQKKPNRWGDVRMSILGAIQNLTGQAQELDLPPELGLTLSWTHFEQEVGPDTSKGPF